MSASLSLINTEKAIRWRIAFGLQIVILLVGGLTGWAMAAKISSAVIAPGQIVVQTNVKKIQHSFGGVVETIRVKEGDRVSAGDVLMTLDPTMARANLAVITSQVEELSGRLVRLDAEIEDRDEQTLSQAFKAHQVRTPEVVDGERRLMSLRRATLKGQAAQLKERAGQLRQEVDGLSAQISAKDKEIELVKSELERVQAMYRQKLLPITRLIALQREAARIEGEYGALKSQRARTAGQISEIELQIIGLDDTFRSDATKELRDVQAKLSELRERQVAAQDQLNRIEIKAPQDGVVHELLVHTVGGFIKPGDTVMSLVPNKDLLSVDLKIRPSDVDHVTPGTKVTLRLTAFNQRTTPEITGSIGRVAADISYEPSNGATFYSATVDMDPVSLARLKGQTLVPGMPVEAFVDMGEHSVVSYLLKPLTDQFHRALREE